MFATLRGTSIYFDIEGAGLVPDGERMRERPAAMVIPRSCRILYAAATVAALTRSPPASARTEGSRSPSAILPALTAPSMLPAILTAVRPAMYFCSSI